MSDHQSSKNSIKVAVLQMTSTEDISKNQAYILDNLNKLDGKGIDLVSLPENALYLRVSNPSVSGFNLSESFWQDLVSWCQKNDSHIHVGSVAFKEENDEKSSNTTIWVDKNGAHAVYKKIHLFDVDVEGESSFRESDHFLHGEKPSLLECNGWKIGFTICYDVRFSELFSYYAAQQADLILVPSAFLVPTGRAHWHVLLRARAIESQAYVVAAAQAGQHQAAQNLRVTYGHSLIVDPWGVVLAEGKAAEPDTLIFTLERSTINKVRRQIPMHYHRRLNS